MKKRVLIVQILLIGVCSNFLVNAAATEPQNVVFMLADDLGVGELSCFGQDKFQTPNIDSLAKDGVKMMQHYSGAPVCAPARCVLMTGKHLGHAEIRGNMQAVKRFPEFREGQLPISAEVGTLAQTFQKAGYATAAMGKWGLGPVGSTGDPNKKGFDLFFGYNCQAQAHSYYPAFLYRNAEKVSINSPGVPGHSKETTEAFDIAKWQGQKYAPLEMIKETEGFLKEQASKATKKPFFLYLAFIEPHVAMQPPLAELDKFPKEWDTVPYRGENSYLPHSRPRAGYAAMVTMLDSYVGRVLRALEEHGFAKNTLVVFSSDNGATHAGKPDSQFHIGGLDAKFFNSNKGLRGYKGSVYEGGLKVPTLVRWPNKIPAGSTSGCPSYFADWFPTLCAATGLEAPGGLDGQNILPKLTNPQAVDEREVPMVWVYPEYRGQVALRMGKHKLVRQGLTTKKPGEWELYDIAADPNEATDIAAKHPEIVKKGIEHLKAQTSTNTNFPLEF